jgi:HAD superfamily hydrolase (TIGR01509 family)
MTRRPPAPAASRPPSERAPIHGAATRHAFETTYHAVLFDMDGVVTNTASLQAAAWKRLFDAVLSDPRAGNENLGGVFDAADDYRRYVEGRSSEDGVAAFLASRRIRVEPGMPQDPPAAWTIAGLAARKNELFLAELDARGLRAFPGTTALLDRLHAAGTLLGLVTASRNAREMLAAADLTDTFDAIVDGQVAFDLGLPGRPDPAMFLEAARRLEVAPERTVVIEDSVSGVEAGRRGRFGLVVGVDRGSHREQLETAGAHIVVNDVGELDLGAARTDPWVLVYHGFDPAHEGHREALTTMGNGRMATRGVLPEHQDDGTHYPGTYIAGVYNRLVSGIHGRRLEEEHLVNTPNWLPLDLRIDDGPWWSSGVVPATDERRELDLQHGMSVRQVTLTGPEERRLDITQRSFVSMDDPHLAVQETTVTSIGWTGRVTIRAGIDASIRNTNVASYIGTNATHLASPIFRQDGDVILCEVQTRQSKVRIATAVHLALRGAHAVGPASATQSARRFTQNIDVELVDGQAATLTKVAAVFTSKDAAISSPALAAAGHVLDQATDVPGALERHQAAWGRLWDRFSVTLDTDQLSQLVLNLHVFHLLQSISPHTAELDAGLPARGLHGEGYRGHVFWDEVFVLPVIGLRLPRVAAALLDYRWHRLGAARAAARNVGLEGALFPWQSGSDGREETPTHLYNERSSRWMPDNSRRQRHVGLAVAWNAWQHYQATGDLAWLADKGAELIIEVTRLFVSLASYDATDDRFHIVGVMGPDEYHDGYPDTPGSGLRDNTYTNILASWVCARAGDALDALTGHDREDLVDRLNIDEEEVARWSHVGTRLAVPIHSDGILSQFDGYEHLAELDWARYRDRYGNIGRLDLILESENDATNRYKAAKQPDVVMLVYLLGESGLRRQLADLGYPFSRDDLRRTVDYYLTRTSDGSTLSRVVHASVLARLDAARSWALFRQALISDLDDTQWGTTREGIHLGAMAGTIDMVLRSFAGLRLGTNKLVFSPRLPTNLKSAEFQVAYRGHRIDVHVTDTGLTLRLLPSSAAPIRVRVGATNARLAGGTSREFSISPAAS